MRVKTTINTPTEAVLTVVLDTESLSAIKQNILKRFQSDVKLSGFRDGKAPLNLVEKQVDQSRLQTEFLEDAINQSYPQAIQAEKLRPVDRPEITIKKFVPFTALEFDAKVAVVSDVKLPDYTKLRKAKPKVTVTADDVNGVLKSLQQRMAEKKDVDRVAKNGDQVWIDFKGADAKGEPVKGADGKDYPLLLGSNTFIPGFEDSIVGLKAGETKTFTLTFPKDYGLKALASKKITFEVSVTKVQEVIEPKLDDNFATKAGPFKTMKDLKEDVKRQLAIERQQQADLEYESELVREITQKTKIDVPQVLIDDQMERSLQELKQNLVYRGQTYQEFLEIENKTEEQYRIEVLRPRAEERVKASLVLAEIAEKEKVEVTPEELEIRMQVLKGQYKDPTMQAELEKSETRRDIAARMLSEKTVAILAGYANKPK